MSQGFATGPAGKWGAERCSLRASEPPISAVDVAWLLAAAALATAAMAAIHLGLRLPGHAILKPALPIAIGLSLVPRPHAGGIVGLGAAAIAGMLLLGGVGEIHASAIASLVLLGPAIDLAARGTHAKSVLLARFAAAGFAANMMALAIKLAATSFGLESGGGRGFAALWPMSMLSFAACGTLAGLLSAAVCLPFARRGGPDGQP
jgi:hypothetical protein